MGLKDYVVPSTKVTLAPSNIVVSARGLNFADITHLVNDHGPVLIMVYGRVIAEAKAGTLNKDRVGEMIQQTLIETPELVASIIAIGIDEPDAIKQARSLTPGVQMELVSAIIGHTFISEAEVKKLVETVTKMLERAGGLATELTSDEAPLTGGSGASDAA